MKKISIGIPTYNRAEALENNIRTMIPFLREYDIDVFIFDDSPNNDTLLKINELIKTEVLSNIYYTKNTERLGHDLNCINVLENTRGDFIWYLGDTYIILEKEFSKIYDTIQNNNFDGVIVNAENRVSSYDNVICKTPSEVYKKYGWHVTLTSSTIYSKKLVEEVIEKKEYIKYINSQLLQTGVFFETIKKSKSVYFYGTPSVRMNSTKKSFWIDKPIATFCNGWYEFNMKLPKIFSDSLKKEVILSHDKNTGLFSNIPNIVLFRANKAITLAIVAKNIKYCNSAVYRKSIFYFSLFIPSFIYKFMIFTYSKLRGPID